MEKTKPLHHIRYGSVEASIWENLTQGGGAFYNVTFAKHYKDGDEWKTSQNFGMGDLLELSKAADHAHTWIARLQEKARENTRAEQTQERRSAVRPEQGRGYSDRVGRQEQRRGRGERMLPPNTGSIFRLLDDGGKKTSVIAAVAFGLGYWLGKNEKYRDYDRQHHERHDEHNRHQYDKHADRESHRNYKHGEGHER